MRGKYSVRCQTLVHSGDQPSTTVGLQVGDENGNDIDRVCTNTPLLSVHPLSLTVNLISKGGSRSWSLGVHQSFMSSRHISSFIHVAAEPTVEVGVEISLLHYTQIRPVGRRWASLSCPSTIVFYGQPVRPGWSPPISRAGKSSWHAEYHRVNAKYFHHRWASRVKVEVV